MTLQGGFGYFLFCCFLSPAGWFIELVPKFTLYRFSGWHPSRPECSSSTPRSVCSEQGFLCSSSVYWDRMHRVFQECGRRPVSVNGAGNNECHFLLPGVPASSWSQYSASKPPAAPAFLFSHVIFGFCQVWRQLFSSHRLKRRIRTQRSERKGGSCRSWVSICENQLQKGRLL